MIEEREKRKRKAEKEMRRNGILPYNYSGGQGNKTSELNKGQNDLNQSINVQTVLPEEDIALLKAKTNERYNREAIEKAVYYFLNSKLTTGQIEQIEQKTGKDDGKKKINYIYAHSKLSRYAIMALKIKARKSRIKDAISIAVYCYLEYANSTDQEG